MDSFVSRMAATTLLPKESWEEVFKTDVENQSTVLHMNWSFKQQEDKKKKEEKLEILKKKKELHNAGIECDNSPASREDLRKFIAEIFTELSKSTKSNLKPSNQKPATEIAPAKVKQRAKTGQSRKTKKTTNKPSKNAQH